MKLIIMDQQNTVLESELDQWQVDKIIKYIDHVKSVMGKESPNGVITQICDFYNITREDLLADNRDKKFVLPRQLGMYHMYKKVLGYSQQDIANVFNKKNHSTVIYAVRTVERKYLNEYKLVFG